MQRSLSPPHQPLNPSTASTAFKQSTPADRRRGAKDGVAKPIGHAPQLSFRVSTPDTSTRSATYNMPCKMQASIHVEAATKTSRAPKSSNNDVADAQPHPSTRRRRHRSHTRRRRHTPVITCAPGMRPTATNRRACGAVGLRVQGAGRCGVRAGPGT